MGDEQTMGGMMGKGVSMMKNLLGLGGEQQGGYVSPVNEAFIRRLNETLQKYAQGKSALEAKILENERWYRSQHWDIVRKKAQSESDPEPVSGYLFSTLANKHADAMDFYPEPNILPREEDDEQEADSLTEMVPLVIEKNDFRKTYSAAWWYKLKQGAVAYGVFWNPNLENGLGDIDIRKEDLLNLYWEPGITDLQKSPVLFVTSLMEIETCHQLWPQTGEITANTKTVDIKTYFNDQSIDFTNKVMVVDAYYKRVLEDGREIVHLTKFVENIPLASTEDDPETAQRGQYDHGRYPYEIDVLFPEEGTPVGFGFVDVIKNPQMYIDKLDQIISKNALASGKQRILIKDNGAINEQELGDLSVDIVHTSGGVTEGDAYAVLQTKPLDPFIVNHRQNKITELKEVSGANDFSRGDVGGGVTAMGAILALQEASGKMSRDIIGDSYAVYTKIVYMCIELIRQFYKEERRFRVENPSGDPKYIKYTNAGLQDKPLPQAFPEEVQKYRRPLFDIKVKPEKASPFSRAFQNEMGLNLFDKGFFSPQRAVEAKVALEMMSFEGKDKIQKLISANGDLFIQMQQLQEQFGMMQQALAESQTKMQGMNEIVKRTTGQDLLALEQQGQDQKAQLNARAQELKDQKAIGGNPGGQGIV